VAEKLTDRLCRNHIFIQKIRRDLKQRHHDNPTFCALVDSLPGEVLVMKYLNHSQPPQKLQTSQVKDQDRYNKIIRAAVKRRLETK